MSKELEAFDRILNANNHFKYDTLELMEKDARIVQQALQRLEAIDNAKPSEALKKLEMLSDCAEAMKEAPSSNWIEYANSETELDYKLWRAYEDLKQYILKAQEQEKVLEIIFKKQVDINEIKILLANLKHCDDVERCKRYNISRKVGYKLKQEEFDLLKRYCNEQDN